MRPPALAVAACRVLLGALFLYAALTKLADLPLFAEEIANYQLLPAALVPLAAIALPGIELVAGALLLVGLAWRPAALVIASLLLVFTIGLGQALVRGIDLACGCFGGSDPATPLTVGRDLLLLGAAAVVLKWGPGRPSLQSDG